MLDYIIDAQTFQNMLAVDTKYEFGPSPLYLNPTVVFKDPPTEAMWELPQGHDPLRPWIGYWRQPVAGFWLNYPTDSKLWFDTINTLSKESKFKSVYISSESQVFVKPYEYPWVKMVAPAEQIPEITPAFRLLAKKRVEVGSTEMSTEEWNWNAVLVLFNGLSTADFLKAIEFKNGFPKHALPHYHLGYVDNNGSGFTTEMHGASMVMTESGLSKAGSYKKLSEFLSTVLSKEEISRIHPVYHTHVLTNAGVDNYEHKNEASEATMDSGLYSELSFTPNMDGSYDWPMDLGAHPINYVEIDEVYETLFLEFMQLHFNNKELSRIVDCGTCNAETADPYLTHSLRHDPLFLGQTKSSPEGGIFPIELNWVMGRYYEKRKMLKEHLLEKYISKMHSKLTFKGEDDYGEYKDMVFNIHGMPDNRGYRESALNYTMPEYEQATNLLGASQHYLIPNPYLLGQFQEDIFRFPKSDYTSIYNQLLTLGNPDLRTMAGHIDPYIREWSRTVINKVKGSTFELQDIWQNVSDQKQIFGFPKYDFISKYASTLYPAYAKLAINTPLFNDNSEFPDKRGTFIDDVFGGLYDDDDETLKKDELMLFFMTQVVKYSAGGKEEETFYVRKGNDVETKEIETYDFADWVMGDYQDAQEFDVRSNKLISFDFGTEEKWNQTTAHNIENAFILFKNKIEEFQNTRSTYEILDAADISEHIYGYNMHPFAHNEIMFYEVEKLGWDSTHDVIHHPEDAETIQRYFIAPPPNVSTFSEKSKAGLIEFIDTQLKIDTGYAYKVNAYVLVVGNEYQYANIQTRGFELSSKAGEAFSSGPQGIPGKSPTKDDLWDFDTTAQHYYINVEDTSTVLVNVPGGGQKTITSTTYKPIADIFALNRPTVKLLKIPYTAFQTLFLANKPPLHPNVVIYPYKNVNNELLFVLSQFVGEKEEIPIEILPEDKDIFMKASYAQNVVPADNFELPGTLKFKSDEPDISYQVFRIEEHPTGWSDFATALREPVLLPDGTRRKLKPYETNFVDDVVPNKKYYYTFRSIDSRGYISNPSPIYEVELIDDSGAVYLVIKIIKFKHKVPKVPTKSMRKYIHIVPTLKQSNMLAPSAESIWAAEGVPQDVHFGDLFGTEKNPRRFKVRFTSKSSGKMFDLNLGFVHKHKGPGAELTDSVLGDPVKGGPSNNDGVK